MSDNNNQNTKKSHNRPYSHNNNRYRGNYRRSYHQHNNHQRPQSTRSTKSSISEPDHDGKSTCICCLHKLDTFVTYQCMHFVCLPCATKMRILLEKFDCPVCRQVSNEVICDKENLTFERADEEKAKLCDSFKLDAKKIPGGLCYKQDGIKNEFDALLEHKCDICNEKFDSFELLSKHIQSQHKRFYCDLCVEYVKLFSFERKHYNREELASHRRKGDRDDTSFKGHPNCDFCDKRFFDRDELYRHFRRDHYYCHFCDADGYEEYYPDYSKLRNHFLKYHFLCELDQCAPKNIHETREYVVFRNEIDLQAHLKEKHARSKNDLKSLSKINIEFNYGAPRDRTRGAGRGHAGERVVDDQRNRNQRGSSLRELYQNYEGTSESQILNEENLVIAQPSPQQTPPVPDTPPPLAPVVEEQIQQVQEQSTWRNLIAQGRAPKINKEAEFPALSDVSSLASIGQSNNKSSGAWGTKLAKPKVEVVKFNDKKKGQPEHPQQIPKSNKKDKNVPEISSNFVDLKNLLNDFEREEKSAIQSHNETFEPIKGKKTDLNENELAQGKLNAKKSKKKSEKKEENLKEEVKSSAQPTPRFPSLNGIESPTIETKVQVTPPPPGFSAVAKSNLVADNYKKSPLYEDLNRILNNKLIDLFDKDQFEKFKKLSIEFRNSIIDSDIYLSRSRDLIPIKNYKQFFILLQEMIVLLPNILKQNELYEAYMRQVRKLNLDSPLKIPEKDIKLVKCNECEQILQDNFELRLHKAEYHKPETSEINNNTSVLKKNEPQIQTEDFPPLASGTTVRNTFSDLPSFHAPPSIFNNPNESLSLVNKKKYKPRYLE